MFLLILVDIIKKTVNLGSESCFIIKLNQIAIFSYIFYDLEK